MTTHKDDTLLKALRIGAKLTQAQMAEHIGLSLRAYTDLESGATTPKLLHLLAAERATLTVALEGNDSKLAGARITRDALILNRLVEQGA